MTELKPCPFCGKKDIKVKSKIEKDETPHDQQDLSFHKIYGGDKIKYYIGCSSCRIEFYTYSEDILTAIKSLTDTWNKRYINEKLLGHLPEEYWDQL